MSDLVTGEAVVLDLRPAKLGSRAVAVAIDLAVWWGTYVVVSIAMVSATASLDTAAMAAVSVATLLLVLVGLPVAVETLSRGRSLGKLVCGLRVVRDDGGPIRFRHALVRGALAAVETQASMGVVACVASLISARGRRLGDVFAGTLVVRERIPAQYERQPPPPSWLAERLGGIDLSGLPDELWLTVRQYLARMEQLDPQVSWTMAARLAEDVAARTGKAAPEGVPPAAYLAAVVAERQAREAQRVFGQRAPHTGEGGVGGTRGIPTAGSPVAGAGGRPAVASASATAHGSAAPSGGWALPGGESAGGGPHGRAPRDSVRGPTPDSDGAYPGQPDGRPGMGFAPPA